MEPHGALPCLCLVRTAPGDVALVHCGVKRAQYGWLVERCQTPASPSKSTSNDGRSIRPPRALHTFHEMRPATQAPGALCSPHFLYWTEGALRGTVRNVLPDIVAVSGDERRALTRRCLIRFCHRHYTRATKPLLIVLARPATTPGRGRNESTSVRMLRAARGAPFRAPPSPTWSMPCRVSFLRPTNRRRYGECQTHGTSRHHALGPSGAETHEDLQPLPWRDRRTFEWRALREEERAPSARGAFHRVHRA